MLVSRFLRRFSHSKAFILRFLVLCLLLGLIPAPKSNGVVQAQSQLKGEIAYVADGNIRLLDLANGQVKQLTSDGSVVNSGTASPNKEVSTIGTGLSWSPDGQWLVFGSKLNNNIDIYRIRADGSNLTRLTNSALDDFSPAYSYRENDVYFIRALKQDEYPWREGHYVIMKLDSSGRETMIEDLGDGGTCFPERLSVASSDKIALSTFCHAGGYSLSLMGSGFTEVAGDLAENRGDYCEFGVKPYIARQGAWARTSSSLAFVGDADCISPGIQGTKDGVFLTRTDQANPASKLVLSGESDFFVGSLDWSPDDRWLVFSGEGLYTINTQGGDLRRVSVTGSEPAWRPGSTSNPAQGPQITNITIFGGLDKTTGHPDFTVPQRAETLRRQEVWLRVENPGGTAIQGGAFTASITLKAPNGAVLERYSYSSSRDNLSPIATITPNGFTFESLAPLRLFTPVVNGTLEVTLIVQGYPATTKSRQISITSPNGSTDTCLAAVTALALRPILSDISEIPGTAAEPLAEALINCNQRDLNCLFRETASWLAEKAPSLLGKTVGKITDSLVLSYELLSKEKQEETYKALVDRGCLRVGAWMNALMFAMRHKGSTKNSVTSESPVYPLVRDRSGRRAGFLTNGQPVQEIPDSRAVVIGDKHLILFDGTDDVQVEIIGYANGTMDLHTFFVRSDGTATSSIFDDVAVNQGMQARTISSDANANLSVDTNADGRIDETRVPDVREAIGSSSKLPGSNIYNFPQTGFTVSGRLWDVWQGGRSFDDSLYINGFPITTLRPEVSTTDGKTYQTQWFERARFEQHPENQPPYDVLLGLLGVSASQSRQNEGPFKPVPNPGGGITWFQDTQHTLGDGSEGGRAIATYWNRLGGLQQFGFPLSQPFMERNKDDGKTYLVQYFQRQRFEYHPENRGTRYEVLLGRLGAEQLQSPPPPTSSVPLYLGDVHTLRSDGVSIKLIPQQGAINTGLKTEAACGSFMEWVFEITNSSSTPFTVTVDRLSTTQTDNTGRQYTARRTCYGGFHYAFVQTTTVAPGSVEYGAIVFAVDDGQIPSNATLFVLRSLISGVQIAYQHPVK